MVETTEPPLDLEDDPPPGGLQQGTLVTYYDSRFSKRYTT